MKKLMAIGVLIGVTMIQQNRAEEKVKEKVDYALATFAGGCFWCMEPPFEKLSGVQDVIAGYIGGTGENPRYPNYGPKGYVEAVQVTYDPNKITYQELLNVFWRQIDPTDPNGQFADRGRQYLSVIFYHTPEQKKLAEQSKKELAQSGRFKEAIVTEIRQATPFFRAEDYHQNFYKTNPVRYGLYRWNSGRDSFLKKVWRNKVVKTS